MNCEFPSESEIQNCFIRFLFGFGDLVNGAINLAYWDMCRTMKNISEHPQGNRLREEAQKLLHKAIAEAPICADVKDMNLNQEEFDNWHRTTCSRLVALYNSEEYKFDKFCVGSAQKWINMTVKYCALLGDKALQSGRSLFRVGHLPIDSLVLQELRRDLTEKKLSEDQNSRLKCLMSELEPWSKIKSYDKYMDFQLLVRGAYCPEPPLVVEFRLWMKAKREQ